MARTKPPLERAARALCELAGNPPGATTGGNPLWKSYLPEAREVIWAIREPSENMIAAGSGITREELDAFTDRARHKMATDARDEAAANWQAMIDTALKEV